MRSWNASLAWLAFSRRDVISSYRSRSYDRNLRRLTLMNLGQPSAATKGLCLDLGCDFPIAIEQPTASRRPARVSNSAHGNHPEQSNSQGREGVPSRPWLFLFSRNCERSSDSPADARTPARA